MARITYNGGAIAAGTWYLRSDGSLTSNANDGVAWVPKGSAPVLLQGLLAGGTSVVTIQKGDRERLNPATQQMAVSVVDEETPNVAGSLSAGVVQDIGSNYLRVKLVQSVGPTTAQLLVLTV